MRMRKIIDNKNNNIKEMANSYGYLDKYRDERQAYVKTGENVNSKRNP